MRGNWTIPTLLLVAALLAGCPGDQDPGAYPATGAENVRTLPPGQAEAIDAPVDTVAIPVVPPAPTSPGRP
jgi:hypothetical protein